MYRLTCCPIAGADAAGSTALGIASMLAVACSVSGLMLRAGAGNAMAHGTDAMRFRHDLTFGILWHVSGGFCTSRAP